jgi:hypothetical protein
MAESPVDVDAIREALAKSQPAPWGVYEFHPGISMADAELIVLLRNNAEDLLDELTTARILVQYADDYENGELSDNGWKDWHAAALRQSRIPKHDQHIPGPWPSNCVICSGDTSET